MASLIDTLVNGVQPRADAAATQAANAALNNIAQRPFNVVLSVDQQTQNWLTALAVAVTIALIINSRRRRTA